MAVVAFQPRWKIWSCLLSGQQPQQRRRRRCRKPLPLGILAMRPALAREIKAAIDATVKALEADKHLPRVERARTVENSVGVTSGFGRTNGDAIARPPCKNSDERAGFQDQRQSFAAHC